MSNPQVADHGTAYLTAPSTAIPVGSTHTVFIAARLDIASVNGRYRVLWTLGGAFDSYGFYWRPDDDVGGLTLYWGDGSPHFDSAGNNAATRNVWIHMAVSRVGGSGNQTTLVYVLKEGFNPASPSYLLTPTGRTTANLPDRFHFGDDTGGTGGAANFGGYTGHLGFYAGAATEAEIVEQFQHRFPIKYPIEMFHDLDATSGIGTDLSVNARNSTVNGTFAATSSPAEPSEWIVTDKVRMGSMVRSDSSTGTGDHTASVSLEIYGYAKRTIIVKVAYIAASTGITAITFDGNAMTLAKLQSATIGTLGGVAIYYYDVPDATAAGSYTVSVTVDGALGTVAIIDAHSLYNVKPGGPEATSGSDNTSTSISDNITTATNGAWIEDALINQTSGDDGAPDTGQYELADFAAASATFQSCSSWKRLDTAGTTAMGWTSITTATGHIHAVAAFTPYSAPSVVYSFDVPPRASSFRSSRTLSMARAEVPLSALVAVTRAPAEPVLFTPRRRRVPAPVAPSPRVSLVPTGSFGDSGGAPSGYRLPPALVFDDEAPLGPLTASLGQIQQEVTMGRAARRAPVALPNLPPVATAPQPAPDVPPARALARQARAPLPQEAPLPIVLPLAALVEQEAPARAVRRPVASLRVFESLSALSFGVLDAPPPARPLARRALALPSDEPLVAISTALGFFPQLVEFLVARRDARSLPSVETPPSAFALGHVPAFQPLVGLLGRRARPLPQDAPVAASAAAVVVWVAEGLPPVPLPRPRPRFLPAFDVPVAAFPLGTVPEAPAASRARVPARRAAADELPLAALVAALGQLPLEAEPLRAVARRALRQAGDFEPPRATPPAFIHEELTGRSAARTVRALPFLEVPAPPEVTRVLEPVGLVQVARPRFISLPSELPLVAVVQPSLQAWIPEPEPPRYARPGRTLPWPYVETPIGFVVPPGVPIRVVTRAASGGRRGRITRAR